MNHQQIIQENQKRLAAIRRKYDPFSGEGSDTFPRTPLILSDCPHATQYIPTCMYEQNTLCQQLTQTGSIARYLQQQKIEPTPENIALFNIQLVKLRIRYDFEFFAVTCLTIKDKITKKDIPFILNRGQRKLLKALEKQRLDGKPLRIILLKARQWGGSTLIQLYMFWIQLVHKKNWNSCICAHTKDAAKNIRSMFTNALANYPQFDNPIELKTFERTDNIKIIEHRGAKITVGSAEAPNSVRSQDAVMVHYSEVAFFPTTLENKPEELIGSVSSSVPRIPYSLIVYESTAKGIGNFFHQQWQLAKEGKTAFTPVFVSWFEIDIYSIPLTVTEEKFINTLTEYEKILWDMGATLEAINWYREKRAELPSDSSMCEEFPSDDIEAFQNSGQIVFNVAHIERIRKDCRPPETTGELTANALTSEAKLKPETRKNTLQNIRFIADPNGNLQIWAYPDTTQKVTNRYIVIVDTGGRSRKADYSVICVIDRYWLMYGGRPEIIAQWRGHTDHDILAWKAAQIAAWYNNALLIFESNTAESEADTDGDHTEFIYDTIATYYPYLYSRTPADKIREGIPLKWGFHTNKSTKPLIIDNYVTILREYNYIERDNEACNEARWYEKKINGSFGAIHGQHDDILMTRMIGLQICYELPLPKIITHTSTSTKNKIIGEASI